MRTLPPPTPQRLIVLGCALCCGLAAGVLPVAAQADANPYYLGGSLGETSLSNVYQTPTGADNNDRLTTATLLGGVDQTIGRQRVYAHGTLSDNRYARNTQLDYVGYTLDSGIDWETVDRLSGHVGFTDNRTLAPFNLGNQPVVTSIDGKNVVSSRDANASVRLGVAGPLSIEARFDHYELNYSLLDLYYSSNYRQNSESLGVLYRVGSSLTLGLAPRVTHATNPDYSAINSESFDPSTGILTTTVTGYQSRSYTVHALDWTLSWIPTPQNSLQARLSTGRSPVSDGNPTGSSSISGGLDWHWQPVDRLTLTSSYSRDNGQNTGAQSTTLGIFTNAQSQLTTRFAERLDYQLSSKIGISFSAATIARTFASNSTNPSPPPVNLLDSGRDRTNIVSVGAAWAMTRNSQLSCSIEHDARTGLSVFSQPYSARSIGCTLQAMLK